jgi:hypothetical protein
MMLIEFLNDMMHDPEMKEAFLKEPEEVMKQSNLSDFHRELLGRGDADEIGAALAEEVRAFASGRAPWVASSVKVGSIAPAGGAGGETILARVTGWFFSPEATCTLENGQERIDGEVLAVRSAVRSSMSVKFSLPEDASPGAWTVRVWNDEKAYDGLPSSFTISE